MHRRLPFAATAVSVAAALALLLSGCTSTPEPATGGGIGTGTGLGATSTPTAAPVAGETAHLPTCAAVTTALAGLQGDLAFDEATSTTQTAQETYQQRVCVYTSADKATQLGVTIASIPFQQSEIDGYATLPNAIKDERLAQYKGVLQTFTAGDADDGHLDSSLYLFDVAISVTIQAVSKGDPTSVTLPQLTVPAAVDAAFAVRALVK